MKGKRMKTDDMNRLLMSNNTSSTFITVTTCNNAHLHVFVLQNVGLYQFSQFQKAVL